MDSPIENEAERDLRLSFRESSARTCAVAFAWPFIKPCTEEKAPSGSWRVDDRLLHLYRAAFSSCCDWKPEPRTEGPCMRHAAGNARTLSRNKFASSLRIFPKRKYSQIKSSSFSHFVKVLKLELWLRCLAFLRTFHLAK